MKLEIISIDEGAVKVATNGQITMADLPTDHQKNPFSEVLGADWAAKNVLLDLSRTGYIDSFAIGWLLQSNKQFNAEDGKLVLYSVPPSVLQVFELLKINRVLTVARDEAEARQLLDGHSHGRSDKSGNGGRQRDGRGRRSTGTGSSSRRAKGKRSVSDGE